MGDPSVLRLDGAVALVTGGARGIGAAVATRLGNAGAAVAVLDVDLPLAEAHAATLPRGVGISADVSDERAVEAALDRAEAALGPLGIVVNNAGIFPSTPFLDLPLEEWERVQAVNVRGTFLVTQRASRRMVAAEIRGAIVNVASSQAFRPWVPGLAAYDTSKAAIVMLTKAAALELAPHGVRVNAVAPGGTITPGTQPILESGALGTAEEHVPLGRWARPEDVANAVLYLASPEAEYVTGSTLVVDGGFLLQ